MDIAIIGLGKMGGNMAQRLLKGGHRVVGLDQSAELTRKLASEHGLTPVFSIPEAVAALPQPRVFWLMVPSGEPTEAVVNELSGLLSAGDVIIDGGNTFYKTTSAAPGRLNPGRSIMWMPAPAEASGVWQKATA